MCSRWMGERRRAGWPAGKPSAAKAGYLRRFAAQLKSCRSRAFCDGEMRMKATVFLGGGRITSALVAGLRLAGYSGQIVVYDRNPEKLRALRREERVSVERDLKSALLRAERSEEHTSELQSP